MNLYKDKSKAIFAIQSDEDFSNSSFNLFRKNKEVVLEAVKKNGMSLKFASKELQNDQEIVIEAVKQNGLSLKYLPNYYKNNIEIVLLAMQQNPTAWLFSSENIKKLDTYENSINTLTKLFYEEKNNILISKVNIDNIQKNKKNFTKI